MKLGLIALAVNFLLLMGTSRLCGVPIGMIRLVIVALIGGLHAVACTCVEFQFLCGYFWRVVILCTMGLTAFDLDVRPATLFILLNIALSEGLSYAADGKILELVLGVGVVAVLLMIGMWSNPGTKGQISVWLPTANGEIRVNALRDSGNLLIDPVTGRSVMVVSSAVAQEMGICPDEIKDPIKAVSKRHGFRLVPYRGVGGDGLLLAKKYENVVLDGKKESVLVAFSPNEIGKGYGFQALIGGAA